MRRPPYSTSYDRSEVNRILAAGPEERPTLKLPKATRSERATPWSLRPVPTVSTAEQKARVERRGIMPSRPGEWNETQ